ncbi:MAG TPA: hypothetical protein VHD69_03030 [Candidatus Paceibacterota bacterium]|nr:hypothetical protein [Candidatus Paceibacterota bacterium]
MNIAKFPLPLLNLVLGIGEGVIIILVIIALPSVWDGASEASLVVFAKAWFLLRAFILLALIPAVSNNVHKLSFHESPVSTRNRAIEVMGGILTVVIASAAFIHSV